MQPATRVSKLSINLSGFCNRGSYLSPQSPYIFEADSDGERTGVFVAVCLFQFFERAEPLRVLYVDRQTFQAVTFGVIEYRCRRVEPHRLIVEQPTGVCRDVVKSGISTRIRNRSEAMGVRFWEHELFHRREHPHNLRLYLWRDSICRHAFVESRCHSGDDRLGSLATHRFAEFFRLSA